MRFATPEELEALWSSGLDDVDVTDAVVSADYEGFEDLWAPFEIGGRPGRRVRRRARRRARRVKAEFRRRLDVGDSPSRSPPARGSRSGPPA